MKWSSFLPRVTAQLHVNRQRCPTDLAGRNTLDANKGGDVYERPSNRKPLANGYDSVLSTNPGKTLSSRINTIIPTRSVV